MKADLSEMLRGKTLRSQIYNSISRNKIATMGKLLRHTVHTQHPHAPNALRYLDFKSEVTEMKTEMGSPILKTDHSMRKYSQSVNQSWVDRRAHSGGKLRERRGQTPTGKGHLQKTQMKSKSQILRKVHEVSPEKGGKGSGVAASKSMLVLAKSKERGDKRGAEGRGREKKGLFQYKSNGSKGRLNLQSIIQQSSSQEQLVTPNSKNKLEEKQALLNSHSQTRKKEKPQLFSESFRRKLARSFKSPDLFQKIMRSDVLTVSYRILKKRLIQIQIYTLRPIAQLKVSLQKGNLQCQSINQHFKHLSGNTLLALFSSVRDLSLDQLTIFPKLHLDISVSAENHLQRELMLPYVWLHLMQQRLPCVKKSKIKTKICLCDLPIASTRLHVLSEIFHTWSKRCFKGQAQFQAGFGHGDQQFSLKLIEQPGETFTLELQGKGEQKLTDMISFLQHLIC